MHWSRAKTVFIILFLCVDIFLICIQLTTNSDSDRIDRDVIRNTVALLESRGITVDEEIIPTRYDSLGTVELESSWHDYPTMARLLIGSRNADDSGSYVSDTSALTFSETGFLCSGDTGVTDFGDVTQIIASLNKLNINADEAHITSGDTSAFACQSVSGVPIFETGVTVTSDSVEGYWILSDVESGVVKRAATRLLPATSILTELLSNPDIPEKDTLHGIELGYTLGTPLRDMQHKLVSVFPAYRITADSGVYVYDAVTGELLY